MMNIGRARTSVGAQGITSLAAINTVQNINAVTILASPSAITSFIRATGGAGGFAVTLPDATLCNGKTFFIIKLDATAGQITVQGTGGQTINGAANWILQNQFQLVEVFSNGVNWNVRFNN